MNKLLSVIIILMVVLFIAIPVLAIDLGAGDAGQAAAKAGYSDTTSGTTFAENLGLAIRLALELVGVIFLAQMVYAGYLWMTAQGEEEQVKKSQTMIKQSIVGLIIVVGAYSITTYLVPVIVEKVATGTTTVPGQ